MALDTKSFPNQFGLTVNFTSTGADLGFGFTAAYLKIRNDSAKPLYVNLGSTVGGSTANAFELRACSEEDWSQLGVGCSGLTFTASSSGGFVSIGAWG